MLRQQLLGLCGKRVIRKKPIIKDDVEVFDFCYEPVTLVKVNMEGNILVRFQKGNLHYLLENSKNYANTTNHSEYFNAKLEQEFCDNNWILEEEMWKEPQTELSEFIGKNIHRVRPISEVNTGFCNGSYKLLKATKYHMLVQYMINLYVLDKDKNGKDVCIQVPGEKQITTILDCRYCNPEDWEIC